MMIVQYLIKASHFILVNYLKIILRYWGTLSSIPNSSEMGQEYYNSEGTYKMGKFPKILSFDCLKLNNTSGTLKLGYLLQKISNSYFISNQ